MGRNRRQVGPLTRALADEIRAERARQRRTQADVITASGIPRSSYVRLETGERPVDAEQLDQVSAALGLTIVELVRRADLSKGEIAEVKGEAAPPGDD